MASPRSHVGGFTLVELAIVMFIVGLLMLSLMYTLSAQVEQRNFEDTRQRLSQARDQVLSFAITNGRLPCPATAASLGDEAPAGGGTCTTSFAGWLPARAIGFQQTDSNGYAIDAWGNRIRYAVAAALNTAVVSCATPTLPHFTNAANLRTNGITCPPNDITVCKSATGITATTCGPAANLSTNTQTLVAVIFSTGKDGATACAGCVDEAANTNGDQVFVFHVPAPSTAANGNFDDQFTWITAGEFYGKLVSAGVLP